MSSASKPLVRHAFLGERYLDDIGLFDPYKAWFGCSCFRKQFLIIIFLRTVLSCFMIENNRLYFMKVLFFIFFFS